MLEKTLGPADLCQALPLAALRLLLTTELFDLFAHLQRRG